MNNDVIVDANTPGQVTIIVSGVGEKGDKGDSGVSADLSQLNVATTLAQEAATLAATERELAQAWAESPVAPGMPDTKSSKTHAQEAAVSAAAAEDARNAILTLTTYASSIPSGSPATATYNPDIAFVSFKPRVHARDNLWHSCGA